MRLFAISCSMLFMILLLSSACSIHGNMKGLYSYYRQTAERHSGLIHSRNRQSI